MAIDYTDWKALRVGTVVVPPAPSVIYRTLELSDAWEAMRYEIREVVTLKEEGLDQAESDLRESSAYDHASLAKAKALVDVRHAEALLARQIEAIVLRFHEQDVST